MNTRAFNVVTTLISLMALAMSAVSLFFSWSQRNVDYEPTVLVQPGALPVLEITEGQTSFELEVLNTSKSNLQYFLQASTNLGCINGTSERPLFYPCEYRSQIIGLSKSDAGKSAYRHVLKLEAHPGAVNTNPAAYMSEPKYVLKIEAVNASDQKILFKSECFYSYHIDRKTFVIDQPVVDTSGKSEMRQRDCHP